MTNTRCKIHQVVFSVVGIFLLTIPSSAATWVQTAGGTYDWTAPANWEDGILPSAIEDAKLNVNIPTGNQTIYGDGAAKELNLRNNSARITSSFTGTVSASNLFLHSGTMKVEGTLTLTGTDGTYSVVGGAGNASPNGVLDIPDGGVVCADGVHALCVGRRYDDGNTPASGRIWLRDGGTLVLNTSVAVGAMSGLMLGRTDGKRTTGTYIASYIQEGGQAAIGGQFMAGYEKGSYGVMSIQGGVLDLPYISNDTRFYVGYGGYGIFEQFGGDICVSTNINLGRYVGDFRYDTTNKTGFEVGSGRSNNDGLKGAYFYAQGGTFSTKGGFNIQGASWYFSQNVNPAHATIAGDAVVTARVVRVGANTGYGKASLNLLGGGTLVTDALNSIPNRPGRSELNANGGKIVFQSTSSVSEQGTFLDAINIYEGGLEIQCDQTVRLGNAGTNVLLRTPGGYGVAVSSVQELSAAYCPPWIAISGGSGSNACAVALVDYTSDSMTNAVMVCPGEGYAANDALTATVVRPWSSTSEYTGCMTLELVENKPGALVKTGGKELAIYAQPEFAGTYEVREGLMRQATGTGIASPNVRAVVVGGTNAMFKVGLDNLTANEANWNPINTGATLTLGTSYGPGTIAILGGADGKPFEQTFASLAVNGTGNVIQADSSNTRKYGIKLSFDTISCAADSQLTIPDPKSNEKVYCTGMPVGTLFKNIVIEGTDDYAMIGDDGQLVKASRGMMMILW